MSIFIASSTLSDTATVSIWYGLLNRSGGAHRPAAGRPPNAAHPVVWIGKVIRFMDRHTRRTGSKRVERAKGVLLAIVPLLLFPFLFTLFLFLLRNCFRALVWAIGCAVVLKTMFAINAMGKHTKPIQEALERNDMEAARKGVHVVSRDVNKLDRERPSPARPESAAEKIVDSISRLCSSSVWAECR